MDYLEHLDLQDTGLRFCRAGETPGHLDVFVVEEGRGLLDMVYQVDLDAGTVWEYLNGGGRAHPRQGKFKVVATGDIVSQYKEQWKSSQ